MIKFDKIQLGYKHLNEKAKGRASFLKATIGHLKCDNCKGDTHVSFEADGTNHVSYTWHYCCPEFGKIIQNKLNLHRH